jgi:hypothetical protein
VLKVVSTPSKGIQGLGGEKCELTKGGDKGSQSPQKSNETFLVFRSHEPRTCTEYEGERRGGGRGGFEIEKCGIKVQ